MRTIIISLITAGLLSIIFFQPDNDNRAELIWSAAKVVTQTSPTPAKNKTKKTQVMTTPDVKTKLDEDEQTPENRLNKALGSPDIDCDGVKNSEDNCLFTYNPNQKDSNKNEIGDVCEPNPRAPEVLFLGCDMDRDGVPDIKRSFYSRWQKFDSSDCICACQHISN